MACDSALRRPPSDYNCWPSRKSDSHEWGVIAFDADKGIEQKCDLCFERLDQVKQPACATECISHCIYAGEIAEVARMVSGSRLMLWYKAGA